MKTNKTYFVIAILLVITFIFSGCGIVPAQPKGTISGQVLVPPAAGEMSKDVSGWVPAAGAEVTIVDANGVTQTVITDENGYYTFENVAVNPNTVITATATVDGKTIVLKGVIPQAVAADEDYDAGTMDPETTALALVVEELIDEGVEPVDINLAEVQASETFTDLVEQVSEVLEEQGNVTEDPDVIDGAGDTADEILNPPAPPSPPSGPSTVAVTSVSIDQEDQALIIGNTLDLTATVEPANATNKNVSWASDNETVATVSAEGTVTAVEEGTTVITVTTEDGSKTDTITIAVSKIYNQTQKTSHNTIQGAIGAATAGDTILVGSGIYNEAISIDKPLTLLGVQAGIDARNRHGDETIIDPNDPNGGADKSWVVWVNASNVTIDGFTIQNPGHLYGSAGLVAAEKSRSVSGELNNLQFRNNILHSPGLASQSSTDWGKFGYNIGDASNVIIENNYIYNIHCDTATPWNGTAAIWPWGVDGLIIQNNKIEDVTTFGVGLSGDNNNVLIADNDISLGTLSGSAVPSWTRSGISVGTGNEDVTIIGNTITNCEGPLNSAGIRIQNAASESTPTEVSGNTISDINIGIAIEPNAVNFNINGNTFSNIEVVGGYRNYGSVGTFEELETVLANNTFPAGSQVVGKTDESGNVNGNKIIVPETGTVYNKRTGDEYSTVQDAVGNASAEDTILLATGTYEEDVTITTTVNLAGTEDSLLVGTLSIENVSGITIEDIDFKVAGSSNDSIKLNSATNISIKNCEFDGDGWFMAGGNRAIQMTGSNNNISIDNCTFKDGYYVTVNGYGDNLTVQNSTIENCKSGINLQNGDNLVVSNTDISVTAQGKHNDTYCVRFANPATPSSNMTITGGEFTVDKAGHEAAEEIYHIPIIIRSAAEGFLDISNTTINGVIVDEYEDDLSAVLDGKDVALIDEDGLRAE